MTTEQMTPEEEVRLRLAAGISPSTPTEYMLRHIPLWVKMSILRRNTGVGGVFNPISLFKGDANGVWYDPSDLRTLFQDEAGTTPVTADGDPVGLMWDKSGNGNHASQSVAASRPVYRTDGTLHWLQFDGVDDHLKVPDNPSLRQTQMSFVLSYLSTTETKRQDILSNGNGTEYATNNWIVSVEISLRVYLRTPTMNIAVGSSSINNAHVGSVVADGVTINGRLDGGGETSITGTFGTNNNMGTTLGAQNSQVKTSFLSGNIFSVVIVAGRSISSAERNNTERYLAEKSGVTLP